MTLLQKGTILAWDTSDLDWDGFWNPLLTLLYVDFIGTMGFLYAAADPQWPYRPSTPGDLSWMLCSVHG